MHALAVALLFLAPMVAGTATLDADGDYVVHYTGASGKDATYVFVPRNKLTVRVVPSVTGGVSFDYRYAIANSARSKQAVEMIELPILKTNAPPTPADAPYGSGPSDFYFSSESSERGTIARWNGVYAFDTSRPPTNIPPGARRDSFRISLAAMGGIGTMRIYGYAPDPPCALRDCTGDDGGDEDFPDLDQQLSDLMTTNNFVETSVPVPAYPFGPATGSTAGDAFTMFRSEVESWPARSQASTSFATQACIRIDAITNALARHDDAAVRAAAADFKRFVRAQRLRNVGALGAMIVGANLDGLVASLDRRGRTRH